MLVAAAEPALIAPWRCHWLPPEKAGKGRDQHPIRLMRASTGSALLPISRTFEKALCRTRTDDPFLTMGAQGSVDDRGIVISA
jgi:hypothetical protein